MFVVFCLLTAELFADVEYASLSANFLEDIVPPEDDCPEPKEEYMNVLILLI